MVASVTPLKAIPPEDTLPARLTDATSAPAVTEVELLSTSAMSAATTRARLAGLRYLARRKWPVVVAIAAALLLTAASTIVLQLRSPSASTPGEVPKPSTVIVSPPRTVAVLPFENLSTNRDDDYIALGIAETVLHRLASLPDLLVIARTSSFAYQDKSEDVRRIGQRLNVRYLVEGSVQRAGSRLRVTARLIDTRSGGRLWSMRFDRGIEDIFAMEDEISQSVARALEASLEGRRHAFVDYGTEAYLTYLQGRALIASRKEADAELAIQRFERALELAPGSAAAYAALAEGYIHLAMVTGYRRTAHQIRDEHPKLFARAEPLLTRALQLDDSLGKAYVLRGWIKMQKGDSTGAEIDYRRGISLSPSYGPGLEMFAHDLHSVFGRDAEALALLDHARQVDPLTPRNHDLKGTILLLRDGSVEEAEALFLQALAVAPDFFPSLMKLGLIRAYFMGQLAEGVRYGEQALAIDPHALWVREHLISLYLDLGEPGAARHVIAEEIDAPALTWLPICLYENNLKGANDLARGLDIDDLPPGPLEFAVRATRDHALASRDFASGRQLMQAVVDRWDPIAGTAEPGDHNWNRSDLLLLAAQWQMAQGEREGAEQVARVLLEQERSRRSDRVRAIALALLGDRDGAIDTLARAFKNGFRRLWWYSTEREPAFASIRNDARFQTLAREARAHAAAQRRVLHRMRRDGTVPGRAFPAAASAKC